MTTGGTVGTALLAYIQDLAGGGARLTSFTAKGWHAQISALTGNARGQAASEAAGLTASKRTLLEWLREDHEPSKANVAKIDAAYQRLAARPFPDAIKQQTLSIFGQIVIGEDDRTRTLKVRGKDQPTDDRPRWARIEAAWLAGKLTPELLEKLYIADVILQDLEFSDILEFPGPEYRIT